MTKKKFRLPSEMPSEEKRTPISARVKLATKKSLEKAAEKHGLSFGSLVSNILDDYSEWLSDSK